jgi:hypothetical protein
MNDEEYREHFKDDVIALAGLYWTRNVNVNPDRLGDVMYGFIFALRLARDHPEYAMAYLDAVMKTAPLQAASEQAPNELEESTTRFTHEIPLRREA